MFHSVPEAEGRTGPGQRGGPASGHGLPGVHGVPSTEAPTPLLFSSRGPAGQHVSQVMAPLPGQARRLQRGRQARGPPGSPCPCRPRPSPQVQTRGRPV